MTACLGLVVETNEDARRYSVNGEEERLCKGGELVHRESVGDRKGMFPWHIPLFPKQHMSIFLGLLYYVTRAWVLLGYSNELHAISWLTHSTCAQL